MGTLAAGLHPQQLFKFVGRREAVLVTVNFFVLSFEEWEGTISHGSRYGEIVFQQRLFFLFCTMAGRVRYQFPNWSHMFKKAKELLDYLLLHCEVALDLDW